MGWLVFGTSIFFYGAGVGEQRDREDRSENVRSPVAAVISHWFCQTVLIRPCPMHSLWPVHTMHNQTRVTTDLLQFAEVAASLTSLHGCSQRTQFRTLSCFSISLPLNDRQPRHVKSQGFMYHHCFLGKAVHKGAYIMSFAVVSSILETSQWRSIVWIWWAGVSLVLPRVVRRPLHWL